MGTDPVERTERFIRLIDTFAQSKKVDPEVKLLLLDALRGSVHEASVFLTRCRCELVDCKEKPIEVASFDSQLIPFYKLYTSTTEAAARWRAEIEF